MTAASERDYWAVVLRGDDDALATWARLLDPRFDPHIEKLANAGEVALKSAEFEAFTDAGEVRGYAINLIDDINGSVKAISKTNRVELSHILEVRKDGTLHATVFAEMGAIELDDVISIGAISTGGAPPPPQPSKVQKWAALAATDDLVRDMLKNLGEETSWYNLYKAYEGVRALAKPSGGLNKKPWAPKKELERFTYTANGIRHGLADPARRTPPANPMSLHEAFRFVQTMVDGIMAELVP